MTDENKTDEALKADESQNEVESPATEAEGLEITDGPISEELREQARPEKSEEEETESESTEEDEVEAPTEEESETESKKEGRKTAESRIKDLNTKKKAAEQKAESLAEQVKKLTTRPKEDFVPQNQNQPEETELTYEELMRRNDALIGIRLAQQENIHRVQSEATEATKAYPELDPDSDSFDSDLSESISQAVLAKVQANPTADVKGFVGSLMKPYKRSLEKQAEGQREAVTKQASQQAMRPTQVREQEKPFSELSIEEMEKKLGSVYR